MNQTKASLTLLLIFTSFTVSYAQSTDIPLGSGEYHELDRLEIMYGKFPSQYTSSIKPVSRIGAVAFTLQMDSLWNLSAAKQMGWSPSSAEKHNILSWSLSPVDKYNMRKILTSSAEWVNDTSLLMQSKHPFLKHYYTNPAYLFSHSDKDFYFTVNPFVLFQLGKENSNNETLFINTRGLEMKGMISKKIGFYTMLSDNQERDPLFVQMKINKWQAVPGVGYYKNYNTTGVDYINSAGYISFNVIKYINVQFGYGNNFLGDGYRSMFLSDYSSNYLFFKLNTNIWKLHYENIFAELTSQYNRNYGDYLRPIKYAAMHDLSMDFTNWLNAGVFESIIFVRQNHFDFVYLNPVIFLRGMEQEVGSPDKAHVGFHAKADVAYHFQFYSQFLLDELQVKNFFSNDGWWGNKWAFQLGGKYINAFGINNLDLQAETNIVRPYTYSHYDSTDNYTNYNQPLADPLGANFKEFIGIANYQPFDKLALNGRLIYSTQGLDSAGVNWGSDIFDNYDTRVKDFGNRIGQGLNSKVLNMCLTASYEIKYNLFIDVSYLYRKVGGLYYAYYPEKNTSFISAAFRWNIGRREYDY